MAKKVKKDFDKEKMYRQIMPSIEPETAEPVPPEDTQLGLHNHMESLLRDKLDHTLQVLGGCGCPRCRMDILALALNQLPPVYAVSTAEDGVRIKKLRGLYEIKTTAALIQAVQTVKAAPRH